MDSLRKFSIQCVPIDDYHCQSADCNFLGKTAADLFSHYRLVHISDAEFSSGCLYSKLCPDKFRSFSGLRKHMYDYHRSFFRPSECSSSVMGESNVHPIECANAQAGDETGDMACAMESESLPGDNSPCMESSSLKKIAAEFVLDLLSDGQLTQAATQLVLTSVDSLFKKIISHTLNEAASRLSANDCDPQVIFEGMKDELADVDLFENLKTSYSQNKFFQKEFGLIMPQKLQLPLRDEDHGRFQAGESQTFRNQDYVVVDLLDQIEQMLNMEDVYSVVKNPPPSKEGHYSRFMDGQIFQNNAFFKAHPDALQIILYLDGIQLCNGLGSYSHDVVYVYFSLGNVDAEFRSSYSCINLLATFYKDQCAQFDLNILLQPIVDSIRKLEEGYEFNINGKRELFFGTLAVIVADNLAAHEVGGFSVAFSQGLRRCRFCLGTWEETQSHFCDRQFAPRTPESHEAHCRGLLIEELRDHISRLYGIKFLTVFNSLKHFSITNGLPPDILHDLLEGVLPLLFCKVTSHCIKQKYFSLSQLNQAIQNFDFGHVNSRDRPSPIKHQHLKNTSLRQSAAQKWLLCINFPMMVGALVPESDDFWHCFLLLLEICRLSFLKTFDKQQLLWLEMVISDFLTLYRELFPSETIIPKMHHLVHYPRLIREYGPLYALWTMRFEGKHSYFKHIQKVTGNFINPPWTLAVRHQLWLCKRYISVRKRLLQFHIQGSKGSPTSLTHLSYGGQIASFFRLRYPCPFVDRLSWLRINSITFKVNKSVVLCPLRGSINAQFGLLVDIISFQKKTVFVCKMFRTLEFNRHLQAFRISPRSDNYCLVLPPSSILDCYSYTLNTPCFIRTPNIYHYVVVKRETVRLLVNGD